jgi:methionine-gamma-lyase
LVERLANDTRVRRVHFPGFGDSDPRGLVGTQMTGPGSVLSFELATDDTAALGALQGFIGALELITPAVSLGSTDTLIQPPAALTHRIVDADARAAAGIAPALLRLSVGLEGVEDLGGDLQRGLAGAGV